MPSLAALGRVCSSHKHLSPLSHFRFSKLPLLAALLVTIFLLLMVVLYSSKIPFLAFVSLLKKRIKKKLRTTKLYYFVHAALLFFNFKKKNEAKSRRGY
jgi:hypothetical protein